MTLHGCEEPRIFTPPLRELTPETSLGFSVIAFAEDVLEMDLMPWQRWLLIHMLELQPDGSLRFRTCVVLIARQNGKSTLSQVIALWFMFVYGSPLIIGTAQDLDVAEEIWQGAVDLVEETPELDELKQHVIRVNGKKSLVLTSGERYKVKAANRRAGRGLSGDVVLLDELREHQSWDAWGAITKTTMARAFALILAMSNAGDSTSIVLRYLRKLAHLALGDPDGINSDDEEIRPDEDGMELDAEDDSLGIFEWSAPPGAALRDPAAWAQANPALGHTITERTIKSAVRTDPEWIFRTEVLCQWSEGTLEGPFPPGAWEASADPDTSRAPGALIALCVDVSWDRSTTYVGLASVRPDGLYHVELIARRAGTDWLADWLTSPERAAEVRGAPVAIQHRGAPSSSLIGPLTDAGIRVVEWGGADLGIAAGTFYDRVRAAIGEGDAAVGLRHRDQPALNLAAATASTRPVGDSWVWDRRGSPTDASPLVAVTGALWCLTGGMPEPAPTSAYEAARLEVF
ncbi:terminase large subunit domain-containing protein [Kribbella sp. NPDC059898]|uniref:terminase large subunit domain-containing protein n=1 Tax=Kribbella sp. NPDC059898 TaxID=3346995 RepID=UPI00365DDACB